MVKKLHASHEHNMKFLEVHKLTPTGIPDFSFYAPSEKSADEGQLEEKDKLKSWKTTENFSIIYQKEDLHQVFICSKTNEESHQN